MTHDLFSLENEIAVVARKPGLDLRSMELSVTQPLEKAVSTVLGVSQVRSKTIRGGCDLGSHVLQHGSRRAAELQARGIERYREERSLMNVD